MTHSPEERLDSLAEHDFLQRKMAAIGPVVSKIAHDINNYLTVITGFTELVSLRVAADEKSSGYLQEVQKAAGEITALTRRFQIYSRRQNARLAPTDLGSILETFKKTWTNLSPSVDFQLTYPVEMPLAMIDKALIEEILRQLTQNSLVAMPQGGTLRIEAGLFQPSDFPGFSVETMPSDPCLLLTISDTGEGIPAEIMHHLFEPFQTGSDQRKGFGLFTVYAMVNKMNARIFLESQKGKGTRVRLLLAVAGTSV